MYPGMQNHPQLWVTGIKRWETAGDRKCSVGTHHWHRGCHCPGCRDPVWWLHRSSGSPPGTTALCPDQDPWGLDDRCRQHPLWWLPHPAQSWSGRDSNGNIQRYRRGIYLSIKLSSFRPYYISILWDLLGCLETVLFVILGMELSICCALPTEIHCQSRHDMFLLGPLCPSPLLLCGWSPESHPQPISLLLLPILESLVHLILQQPALLLRGLISLWIRLHGISTRSSAFCICLSCLNLSRTLWELSASGSCL
jgi:hypothetical protein